MGDKPYFLFVTMFSNLEIALDIAVFFYMSIENMIFIRQIAKSI